MALDKIYDGISIRVAGIPALADVCPYENGEVEIRLYDRKGYRAKWLERKLDSWDWEDLSDQIEEILREENECQRTRFSAMQSIALQKAYGYDDFY